MSAANSVAAAFLLPAFVSAASALLAHLLRLPSLLLLLLGLHTFILPDSLPPSSTSSPSPSPSPRALLLPPSSSSSSSPSSSAQLLRLRLSLSDLHSRPHFPSFHSSLLLPFSSLPLLLLPFPSPFLPFLSSSISSLLLLLLLLLRPSPSPSPSSLPLLSLPLALLLPSPSPSPSPTSVAVAFSLSFLLQPPAALSARAFWLATDQPRLRLPVLSPSPPSRLLLHLSLLSAPAASLAPSVPSLRIPSLAAAPLLLLLSLRVTLQSYLNESVLSWYQRLHAGRAPPDLDYARANVFLRDRRLCAIAAQLLAPPLLSLLLLGVSQLRGNLFAGVPFWNSFSHYSDSVKEAALFMSWWITLAWSVLTLSNLALYRFGWLFIS